MYVFLKFRLIRMDFIWVAENGLQYCLEITQTSVGFFVPKFKIIF